jgi:hypothetical protein
VILVTGRFSESFCANTLGTKELIHLKMPPRTTFKWQHMNRNGSGALQIISPHWRKIIPASFSKTQGPSKKCP